MAAVCSQKHFRWNRCRIVTGSTLFPPVHPDHQSQSRERKRDDAEPKMKFMGGHVRNFGLSRRSALGGNNTPTGSHGAEQTRANSKVIYPNFSRGDEYELGGALLFIGVILGPVVIVLGLALAYMAFIA